MHSIFSKIVIGEIPCYKIAEDENFLAFLDINPLTIGHTLVIPKKEIDYYFDIDDELMTKYSIFTKRIAKALKLSIPCVRVGVAIMGLEVPHAHIHLIPFENMGDMNFANPKLKMSTEELKKVAESIKQNLTF